MAFPAAFIDELVARNPIEDVVGQYVNLRRSGANLFGLCRCSENCYGGKKGDKYLFHSKLFLVFCVPKGYLLSQIIFISSM